MKPAFILLSILLLFFSIAFYKLHELPGEWYNDISVENEYEMRLLRGDLPWEFSLSSGPVYYYAIFPVVYLFGASWESYKLASILIASFGIIGVFLLGKILFHERAGYAGALVTSISFLYISWARLGTTPHMICPILSIYSVIFYVLYRQQKRISWLLNSIVFASLGLFTYPAVFVLPVVIFAFLISDFYTRKIEKKDFLIAFVCVLSFFVLFAYMIGRQMDEFGAGGYTGSKFTSMLSQAPYLLVIKTVTNFVKTLGMFHIKGDVVFRYNVPESPHLDFISGVLLLAGVALLWKKYRKNVLYFAVPMLILILPSISPGNPDAEIPSASRTLSIFPFVYVLIGLAIYHIAEWLRSHTHTLQRVIVVGLIFMNIAIINLYQYFVVYPKFLPNGNVAYGKIIAEFVDTLPERTAVFMPHCCWGDWGQPEPQGVYFRLRRKENRGAILEQTAPTCEEVSGYKDTVFIFSPSDIASMIKYRECFPDGATEMHTDMYNQKIYYTLRVKKT